MPIQIGKGDIANQLRNWLDLRGRVALGCDETLVPVLLAGTSDVPGSMLGRQGEGAVFSRGLVPTVGQFALIAFGPTSPDYYFVLRALTFESTGARFTLQPITDTAFTALGGAYTNDAGQWTERFSPVAGGGPGPFRLGSASSIAGLPAGPMQWPPSTLGWAFETPWVVKYPNLLVVQGNIVTVSLSVAGEVAVYKS